MEAPLRILYVAADDHLAGTVASTLEQAGYELRLVRVDGLEATREALLDDRWDLILTESNAARLGAAETIGLLNLSRHDIPLIVLSEPIGEEGAVELMHSGASDIVLTTNLARLGPSVGRAVEATPAVRDVNGDAEWQGRTLDRVIAEKGVNSAIARDDIELERAATEREELLGRSQEAQERKRTEEGLGSSEQRFRELVENILEVFWTADAEFTRFLYVSTSYEKIWGRSVESLYQDPRSFLKAIYPDDRERVLALMTELRAGQASAEYRIVRPDGDVRWLWVRGFPVRDEAGEIRRVVGISEDITDRKRREEEHRFLAKTGQILAASLEYDVTLRSVARLAVPEMADWCVVDVLDGINVRRISVACADPKKADLAQELVRRYPPDPEATIGVAEVIRTGEPLLLPEISQSLLESIAHDEEHLRVLQGLGLRSAMLVPMIARVRTLGVITFVAAESGRRYGTEDLAFAEELAARAALAVENSQLYRKTQEAQERTSNILESVTDAFFALDHDWRLTYLNRRAATIFEALGKTREAIVGRSLWEAIPETVGTTFDREYHRAMAQQKMVHFEEYFAPLKTWFEVHAYPSREGLLIFFQDVTERREREQALHESGERLSAIFSQTAAGIAQRDLTGRFVLVNDRFCDLVGRSREELLRLRLQNITHPDDLVLMEDLLEEAIKTGRGFTIEKRYIRPGGAVVYVNSSISIIRGADGMPEYVLSVAADITDHKRIEELERSNRELQVFAHVASHDLKEPLRKVETFATLLAEEYEAAIGEKGGLYVKRILSTVDRMRTLIEDLLAYGRVTSQARPIVLADLDRIAREAISDLEAQIQESGGSVEVQPLPTIEADPVQMRQLFQNLIGNGLKFRREEAPPVVHVFGKVLRAESAANEMLFRLIVEDNGIGFDEKFLDQIFMPFRRLHERDLYPGTGIGLAICRRIAKRHGGSITARSRTGQGSTFTVTLPVHHVPAPVHHVPDGSSLQPSDPGGE